MFYWISFLQFYPGPPLNAVEEIIALTDPSLSLFNGDEEGTNEGDERPILRLTQFGIYDQPGISQIEFFALIITQIGFYHCI